MIPNNHNIFIEKKISNTSMVSTSLNAPMNKPMNSNRNNDIN